MAGDDIECEAGQIGDLLEDALAENRMKSHLFELVWIERARLPEDPVRDSDLADVMEQEPVFELGLGSELGIDAAGQLQSQRGHALRVSTGLVVTQFERGGQCPDGGGVRRLEALERLLDHAALRTLGSV